MRWLAERFAAVALEGSKDTLVRTAQQEWTAAELAAGAESIRVELEAIGARPDTYVAFPIGASPETIMALIAVAQIGATPALIDDRAGPAEVARTLSRVRPSAVVLDASSEVPTERAPVLRMLRRGRDLSLSTTAAEQPSASLTSATGVACLLFSSGTTARPKGVLWSDARLSAIAGRNTVRPDACAGLVVPLGFAMGFLTVAVMLARGTPIGLIEEPLSVPLALAAMKRMRVTGFACTPTHVELLLEANLPLPSCVRHVRVTGAPISADRLRELAERIRPASLVSTYGLAEVGTVSLLGGRELERRPETVGRSLDGVNVSVVDASGDPLPVGEVGEIVVDIGDEAWVDGADGYLEPSAHEAARFDRGRLHTGDRGALDSEGFLVLSERTAELIKVAGRLVSAPSIEARLGEAPGAPELAIVGVLHELFGEVPVLIHVPVGSDERLALFDHASSVLRADEAPRVWLERWELPRGGTGKLRRHRLVEEARAYCAHFLERVPWGGRLWPSWPLEGDRCLIDGARPGFLPLHASGPGRAVILAHTGPPVRPIGRIEIGAGHDAASSGIRRVHVVSVEDGADTRGALEPLIELALSLPGRTPTAVIVDPMPNDDLEALRARGAIHAGRLAVLPTAAGPMREALARRIEGLDEAREVERALSSWGNAIR